MATRFDTPDAAEAAFYRAIETADLQALEQVWSASRSIVCIHPGSARIEGRRAVLASFSDMFAQTLNMTRNMVGNQVERPCLAFSISDTLQTTQPGLAIHMVREEVAIDGVPVSSLLATNIYHLEDGGWRMLLHHASHEFDDSHADFDEQDEFDEPEESVENDQPERAPRPPVLH